jgi:hypothetical protein
MDDIAKYSFCNKNYGHMEFAIAVEIGIEPAVRAPGREQAPNNMSVLLFWKGMAVQPGRIVVAASLVHILVN